MKEISGFSVLTCVQQSVMNLGILLVQGVVNSFGTTVMAAFAAAVKIDAFAYMPVQDFGNAFSTFIAQNYGAKKEERIRAGLRGAIAASMIFCVIISAAVWVFARPLMLLFVKAEETAIVAEGVRYLRIEGAFYCGIGCLFLLYGLYRALGRPGMSVVLTILSLGTRVVLAYVLSAIPAIGVAGIWWSVPIGWILADTVGLVYYGVKQKKLFGWQSKR
ncbi:MAG: MATE family efflux transporter, partial [Lachnospiraceae bacterium]|nr:MATE family efflux transporter [Lachnospiraceae bacterium]